MKASTLAGDIMDLYIQDYGDSNDDFFDDEFFKRQVADTRAALLDADFKTGYAALRSDRMHQVNMVSFDPLWLVPEDIEIKEGKAVLKHRAVSFAFDNSAVGVQDVIADDCNLIRVKYDQGWMMKDSDVFEGESFWFVFPSVDKTVLKFKGCKCKSATVLYIPEFYDDMEINQAKADAIKDVVLRNMFAAKNGGFPVDQTNDSNKNKVKETEINSDQIKE